MIGKVLLVARLSLVGILMVSPAFAADKIGAVLAVTGPASALGDPEKKTIEMIVEKVNNQGGIKGEKLELVLYDTEGDANKAAMYVKKLIMQDKVIAIVGPTTSGTSLAVIPLAEKSEIPLISCAASHKIVHNDQTGKPYRWVFKSPQSDSLAVEAIFTHMQRKKFSKIALLSVTSGFGASGREELLRLAPVYGMQIVADEKYDPKDTDMTTQLTKIKASGAQAIINWSIGPPQVTVVRNWRDLGMQGIAFYQSHGFGSLKNIELSGGAAEGVYCPLGACNIAELLPADHPQKQVTMAYLKEYTAKYNEPLSSFGGHAWDAASLLIDALNAVGKDRGKIRDHLENRKNFVGQHGVFNMSPDDHNGLGKESFQMVVVKGSGWALAD